MVDEEVIESLKAKLPELPAALKERLATTYDLTEYESSVLVNEAGAADYFEAIASKRSRSPKLIVNWVLNDLFSHLKATNGDIPSSHVSAQALGELLDLITDGTISGKIAKDVLEILFYENAETQKTPVEIVTERQWMQIQDDASLRVLCQDVLQDPVRQFGFSPLVLHLKLTDASSCRKQPRT